MQQQPRPVATDVYIGIAVVVVIADRASKKVAGEFIQSSFPRDIRKVAFAVAFIQRKFGADQQNVKIAVVIIIQKGAAVADGLQDIERALAFNTPLVVDSGGFGNVGETRGRLGWGGRRRSRFAGRIAGAAPGGKSTQNYRNHNQAGKTNDSYIVTRR